MATDFITIPEWPWWQNASVAAATTDLDGDGRPELIVLTVDDAEEANTGWYRVGRALDAGGKVTGGWGDWTPIPDWFPWENQGAGAAVADLDGDGRPELLVLQVDNPARASTAPGTRSAGAWMPPAGRPTAGAHGRRSPTGGSGRTPVPASRSPASAAGDRTCWWSPSTIRPA